MRTFIVWFFALLLIHNNAQAGYWFSFVESAGGDPATGTILVGLDSHTDTSYNQSRYGPICTQFEALLSGTAHTIGGWEGAWDATVSKMMVYDTSLNLLADTTATAVATGVKELTLDTAITITAGVDYILCFQSDTFLSRGFSGTGTYPKIGPNTWTPAAPDPVAWSDESKTFATSHIYLKQ